MTPAVPYTSRKMPFIRDSSTPGSSDVENDSNGAFGAQQVTNDISYAGTSLPGYSEKPLSEQLDPIAVVGMGNNKPPFVSSPRILTHT